MPNARETFKAFIGQVVGQVRVNKPQDHTRHYEVAAWSTKMVSDIGVFDLKLHVDCLYPDRHPFVSAVLPATITDDYTPTLFGGVVVGKGNGDKNIGTRSEFGIQRPLWMALKDSGHSGGAPIDWGIKPGDLWDLCDTDMEQRMLSAVDRIPKALAEYQAGDDKYRSRLSMLGHYGQEIGEWEDRLSELRRHRDCYRRNPEYLKNFDYSAGPVSCTC